MYKYSNKESVLLLAKTHHWFLFDKVHVDLLKDKLFVLEMVKIEGYFLKFVHSDLQKDKEVVREAMTDDGGWVIQYTHPDLRKDREIVLEAVKRSGRVLKFAHIDLQKDMEIVCEAVKNTHYALKYIHPDIMQDEIKYKTLILIALINNNFEYQNMECVPKYIRWHANKKEIISYLSVFVSGPEKFPFNDTIYPDIFL